MSNATTTTCLANLTALNHTDNPRALGGEMLGNDSHGNQLWAFGGLVANRHVAGNGDLLWSGDVEGWNYSAADVVPAT